MRSRGLGWCAQLPTTCMVRACTTGASAFGLVGSGLSHLVHKRLPGQVGHSLELVVEEELREHEQEPKGIHPTHEAVDGPGVPAAGNDRTSRDLSCPLVQFNTSGHDSGTDLLCVL